MYIHLGINKPNVRWVVHFHAPLLLSEYVQEVGRAGRDGEPATALTLISETTGWLDPEDKQRRLFFENHIQKQQSVAQQLAKKLPPEGEVSAIAHQFPQGALALSWLHGAGRLEWQDPFHYTLTPASSQDTLVNSNTSAAQQMLQYLKTRRCRWQFLLNAFGFSKDAETLRCGHCDRCRRGKGHK